MTVHAPLTEDFTAVLRKSMLPFLGEAVDSLSADPSYLASLEDILGLLRVAYPEKPWPKWAANGTLRFNRTVIQAELEFRKTGEYSRRPEDAAEVESEIYSSSDVMEGFYLVGLLLTYFTWIHHTEMLNFYRKQFLDAGAGVSAVMEWGVGHGLFTLLASRTWPEAQIFALDISQHSLEFSRRLLKADGADARSKFFSADILSPDVTLPGVDRLICSELMEHVPDPHALGRRIHDVLNKNGKAFVTAAINAPQPDHIYLFRSREEVEELIAASGLRIEAALPLVHPNHKGREAAPTVLAMVVAKVD